MADCEGGCVWQSYDHPPFYNVSFSTVASKPIERLEKRYTGIIRYLKIKPEYINPNIVLCAISLMLNFIPMQVAHTHHVAWLVNKHALKTPRLPDRDYRASIISAATSKGPLALTLGHAKNRGLSKLAILAERNANIVDEVSAEVDTASLDNTFLVVHLREGLLMDMINVSTRIRGTIIPQMYALQVCATDQGDYCTEIRKSWTP
ncbi:hypothetical protein EDD85DRAFT_794647 [Armillaria nabsnona]|nr:hypothetical protein EDD85DRAFT_794647 [Armillaria nabsnona]